MSHHFQGMKRVFSLLFVFAFLIALLPLQFLLQVYASEISKPDSAGQSLSDPVFLLQEETELRDLGVKVFRNSDGTHTAVSYPEPVHCLQDGALCDIDNTLHLQGNGL